MQRQQKKKCTDKDRKSFDGPTNRLISIMRVYVSRSPNCLSTFIVSTRNYFRVYHKKEYPSSTLIHLQQKLRKGGRSGEHPCSSSAQSHHHCTYEGPQDKRRTAIRSQRDVLRQIDIWLQFSSSVCTKLGMYGTRVHLNMQKIVFGKELWVWLMIHGLHKQH